MNLQELQTIAHHKLPVKIIVFSNNGYRMIQATQDVLGLRRVAVDPTNGVSFPNFRSLAQSFCLAPGDIYTWEDFHKIIPAMIDSPGPTLIEYHMDPEQAALPKLAPIVTADGIRSPALDEMTPVIT